MVNGNGVTLRAFLSPLRHLEQLLLVTSCDLPAGFGASHQTDERTNERTNGRTDGQTEGRTENLPILQDFVPYRGHCPKMI